MPFSEEQIEQLQTGYAEIAGKYATLLNRFADKKYSNDKAAEYASHGVGRRLKLLVRCIDNVYELLPPDLTDIPSEDQVSNAVINIQASIFNTFGCMDNFAWIWVKEKGVTNDNGEPLPNSKVGLRKQKVRQSFSEEFQTYLRGLDPWFNLLEDFRHALAHRVPLYIPPFMVSPEDVDEYHRLDRLILEASLRNDSEESERLTEEQRRLRRFDAIMTHSFEEKAKLVVFHAQLLSNFNTVDELGHNLLDELNR